MIYDCFMYFNEDELLDLRFKTLCDTVDYFVIAEIDITHSGKSKGYLFDIDRFTEYKDKIIYLKDFCYPQENPWIVENAHRNLISKGIVLANPEDYILISDLDEIPNPEKIKEGISLNLESFGFKQDLFYFYVNNLSGIEWRGTVATKKRSIKSPQDVRNNRWDRLVNFNNGGWHYSSMGGKERIRTKFEAFAENQLNVPSLMGDENLDVCLQTGRDLTARGEDF
jgi:beta-1,4-mannosyl-glycoprotein beta-1,4-N-acetylglucosaminyltransferase